MLQVHDLRIAYGAVSVLDGISFSLHGGEAVAVVGANGCGKTTLMKCLTGEITDFKGEVALDRSVTSACVHQESPMDLDGSAMERALSFDPELARLYKGIRNGRHEYYQDYYESGGFVREDRIRAYAANFGVETEQGYRSMSRGQQRKADLAGVLALDPDLMLFDEPLNYLDIRGITAFEEAIGLAKRRGRAILIVSHDRELIDNVADRTIYLERGSLFSVRGGYSTALEHKEREFHDRSERARTLRKKISSLQEAMRRRMAWGASRENETIDSSSRRLAAKVTKGGKAMERRLERHRAALEDEKPWIEKKVRLNFPPYEVDRRLVARMESAGRRLGGKPVLETLDLVVETRDRIALMGPNGAGKTTLLNVMMGNLPPDSGAVYFNTNARVGYLTQGLDGFYEREIFLDNFIDAGYGESEVRQYLGAARLKADKVVRPVQTLSYGERMRGAIVKMILKRMEFLVLDEPTTHLDIESVEVLEGLLETFPGGFLVVSHDRRLISRVADEVYILDEGRLERL
ncbi:MAG: ABC-F family ATP-binding cassette domain-containing protein [Gemmatimonadota bacterium]|nr:ABC-F family ATP-binding cassette domain-containing protein [Gemmatimonadota bacterium]